MPVARLFPRVPSPGKSSKPSRVRAASRRQRPEPEAAVELVRGHDHGERLACGPFPERECVRLRERAQEEGAHAAEALGRELDRLVRGTRRADRATRAREVADERFRRAAFDAGIEVREVAGEPEELELKAERERVERRTAAQAARD